MMRSHPCRLLSLPLLLLFPLPILAGDLPPEDKKNLPNPTEIESLDIYPPTISLTGPNDGQQLILTATLKKGKKQDLTGLVPCTIVGESLGRITKQGRVIPRANGQSEIRVEYGPHSASASLTISGMNKVQPVDFVHDISPLFSKLGCNASGCHGKQGGQNGFALSLFGLNPRKDYEALVMDARGRRVFPASPVHSLLLLKAANVVPHKGGKRLKFVSEEYALIHQWIASGMLYERQPSPELARISVFPQQRTLKQNAQQPLAVTAHYVDGSQKDITRLAQYVSNNPGIVGVNNQGMVSTFGYSGQGTVIARFRNQIATFQAFVPGEQPVPDYPFEPRTLVDKHFHKQWQRLGLVPSVSCNDEQFLRRVTLHLTGRLPTPKQIRTFLASAEPQKRQNLVDRLLDSPEFSQHFANLAFEKFRVQPTTKPKPDLDTVLFYNWLQDSFARDKPYNLFAREILGAVGDAGTCPPTVWYRNLSKPEHLAEDSLRYFLGIRLECARCHPHPDLSWDQEKYWGLAAFFGQVDRKNVPVPVNDPFHRSGNMQVVFHNPKGIVPDPRTGEPALMCFPDMGMVELSSGEDPRHRLAHWILQHNHRLFVRCVINRYWTHFFHRGLFDPKDPARFTSAGLHEELLDALAEDFVKHNYSVKRLIRNICQSQTYQLSSEPNEYNDHDEQCFSRFYARPLMEMELYDSLCQFNGDPITTLDLPKDKNSPLWSTIHRLKPPFLETTTPVNDQDENTCSSNVHKINSGQKALELLEMKTIQERLARPDGLVDRLAKDPRLDQVKVEELFLWILGRRPSAAQMNGALLFIQSREDNKKEAYERLLWALLGTRDFLQVQ